MTAHTLAHREPQFPPIRHRGSIRSPRVRHGADIHSEGTGARTRWIKILEIVAVIALAIALIAAIALTSNPQERSPFKITRVFVEKGDTLWSLAQAHPIPGQTTEQTAALIATLNSLDSSGIAAGSVVKLPQAGEQAPLLAQR